MHACIRVQPCFRQILYSVHPVREQLQGEICLTRGFGPIELILHVFFVNRGKYRFDHICKGSWLAECVLAHPEGAFIRQVKSFPRDSAMSIAASFQTNRRIHDVDVADLLRRVTRVGMTCTCASFDFGMCTRYSRDVVAS